MGVLGDVEGKLPSIGGGKDDTNNNQRRMKKKRKNNDNSNEDTNRRSIGMVLRSLNALLDVSIVPTIQSYDDIVCDNDMNATDDKKRRRSRPSITCKDIIYRPGRRMSHSSMWRYGVLSCPEHDHRDLHSLLRSNVTKTAEIGESECSQLSSIDS